MSPIGGRVEVAVSAELELIPSAGWNLGDPLEQVTVWFEGRRFVWHPGSETTLPVVSIMADDFLNLDNEWKLIERFLSALSFQAGVPIRTLGLGGSTARKEFDKPSWQQPRRPGFRHRTGPELLVEEDSDLRLCLALMREGMVSRSPALELLSYWKVVEVAVGGTEFGLWIRQEALTLPASMLEGDPSRTGDEWFEYLRESRIAAAHAVPWGEEPFQSDPDDPLIRQRLARDSTKLRLLAKKAIHARWDKAVENNDPPEELLGKGKRWPFYDD